MKKPTPQNTETATQDTVPAQALPLPHQGGSYIRLADGTLQLEEATDNRPEARAAAALEGGVEAAANDTGPNTVTEA